MQLCKVQLGSGEVRVAILADDHVQPLRLDGFAGLRSLSDILHADNPQALAESLRDEWSRPLASKEVDFLAPLDHQEVWAAGVTYKRSQEARERESAGAGRFYDLVYSAPRPELFFKAPAYRVCTSGERLHIRRDSKWNVPEPELALVISPRLKLVGFTIGNDMSSRDIEGENPLYLPQAKFYDHSCAVGPVITLAGHMPPPEQTGIRILIERGGKPVFEGQTTVTAMKRSFEELISWLGRETSFPHGVILLTGTGIVPPDDFTLAVNDVVHIDITGIGRLTNHVEQRPGAAD
jgi:2-dehydro-3-deoxy-D-arabinonate dehydratase